MTVTQPESSHDNPLATACPAAIIDLRVSAFRLGDFGLIYDSYHPDSFFRAQFPQRDEYIRYAWAHLRRDFKILRCEILRERQPGRGEYHLIFHQTVENAGERIESFEMARLYRTDGGWRYHSSQKMSLEQFQGTPAEVDFADFERLSDRIFF